MKILITGVSSFTGLHFANRIAKIHKVYALFTKSNLSHYDKIKTDRINKLNSNISKIYNINTKENKIIELINEKKPDVFCCHGGYTENYNNKKFNLEKSIKENTFNFTNIIKHLKKNNCKSFIYSSSYFSPIYINNKKIYNEYNPYGFSKFYTSNFLKKLCKKNNLAFKQFVISNPFGPFEKPYSFANVILSSLISNQNIEIKFPNICRDWIHINNLSKIYKSFILDFNTFGKIDEIYPSQYRISNKAFCLKILNNYNKDYKYNGEIYYNDNNIRDIRFNHDKISKFFNINDKNNWSKYFEYYLS